MEKFEDNFTFEDIINQTFKEIKVGSTITGTIVEINEHGEIFVDIGYKADGIIPRNEYFSENDLEPAEEYKVGDKIKVKIKEIDFEKLIAENKALKDELTARRAENQQTYVPKSLELTEYKTRKIYIDTQLADAGWKEGENWINEVELPGMPSGK